MNGRKEHMHYRIGVDIGGTFTDCVIVGSDGEVMIAKSPTTPEDFSQGFMNSIEVGAGSLGIGVAELLGSTSRLAHGTTVGINAVVSRTGARVGLLATKGHGDALRILNNTGRTNGMPVEIVLDYAASYLPERFVRRGDVVEVSERIDCFGEVVVDLNHDEVARAAERLLEQGVETLAVSYLWSQLNSIHEDATIAFLTDRYPELYVSSGARLAQKIGEYPRTATAVLNSYIGPLMSDYMGRLVDGLRERGYDGRLLFAQCDGGLIDASDVIASPITTLQSGPAGGVVGCAKLGVEVGDEHIIAADMGGTTFDVSVVAGGKVPIRRSVVVEQHDLYLRMVDVESVGAGGGSLARIDPKSGALRVGPQSAGAMPGPVCYGRGGTVPTVTDADLVLGLLNPDNFLGGRMRLDVAAAEQAIELLGREAGLSMLECAAGIQTVADSLMEDKIRSMTVSRGHDPRDFALYAFGGGGAVHAALFSRGLGIRKVVVPVGDLASVWSAYGIGLEGYGRTYEIPIFERAPFDAGRIADAYAELETIARAAAERSGVDWSTLGTTRLADLKYSLQVFDVEAQMPAGDIDEEALAGLVADFERNYQQRYGEGAGYPEGGIDLTAVRVTVEQLDPLRADIASAEVAAAEAAEPVGHREVYWAETKSLEATPVYDGQALRAGGAGISGPALIDLPDTTVVLRPDTHLDVEVGGNLTIHLED
jgi:N-methylhydantoinase A